MRWLWVVFLTLFLAACAARPTPPIERKTPLPLPQQQPAAAGAVRAYLAESLDVQPAQVSVQMLEAVEWPDSCLGLPVEGGETCGAEPVPGYRWLAESGGEQYMFHTDQSGRLLKLAPGLQ